MTASEVVGSRLRQAREEARISQEELGSAVARHLGRRWSKQTISLVERGKRDLAPAEMLTLAAVLGRPLWWFFLPEDETIRMPGGTEMRREELTSLVLGPGALPESALGALEQFVTEADISLEAAHDGVARARRTHQAILNWARAERRTDVAEPAKRDRRKS